MSDNPYLNVLSKRLRNLRKRLLKIRDFEKEKADGKVLNTEQLEAVATKSFLERSIADMDLLMEQLAAVAKESGVVHVPTAASTTTSVPEKAVFTEEDLVAAARQFAEMELKPPKENKKAKAKDKDTEGKKELVSVGVSTQMFQTPPEAPEEPATAEAPEAVDIKADVATQLRKLLRALHVCARYTSQTGKALPAELDYFGSMTLGQVLSLGADFPTNLNQSIRHVGFFLYVRTCACVYMYCGLCCAVLCCAVLCCPCPWPGESFPPASPCASL